MPSAMLIADRYRAERPMARGGMGTVWFAHDDKLGRPVALKIMAQKLASMPVARARFEREAKAVAQLRSDHVVEVYDFGLHDGLPYIVMELLDGENLGQRLKTVGRVSISEAEKLVRQVALGLKVAHNAGLVHRDLKPNNIYLARRDDHEIVKLLDFGVVKIDDGLGASEATATGVLLGTPQYMSPEQASARREIDHRSDLWSVGVLLFRALTGVNPFKGDSVGDVVLRICTDPLPQLAQYAPSLPSELQPFFTRAFERDISKRFQSASELSDAFSTVCQGLDTSQRAAYPLASPSQPGMTPTPTPWSTLDEAQGVRIRTDSATQVMVDTSGMVDSRRDMLDAGMQAPEATPISTVGGLQVPPHEMRTRPPSARTSVLVGSVVVGATLLLGVAAWLAGTSTDQPLRVLGGVSPMAERLSDSAGERAEEVAAAAAPAVSSAPAASASAKPTPSAAKPPVAGKSGTAPRPAPTRPKWF